MSGTAEYDKCHYVCFTLYGVAVFMVSLLQWQSCRAREEIPHLLRSKINSTPTSAAFMRQWTGSSLVQVMACRLFGAKPLPEPVWIYCQLDSWEQVSVKFESEFDNFYSRKCIWKCPCPQYGTGSPHNSAHKATYILADRASVERKQLIGSLIRRTWVA